MYKIDSQIDDFMLFCQSKGLAKKTMASYEQTIRLFALYLEDNYQITDAKDVTSKMVREYIKHLQERGKYTVVVNAQSKKYNVPENRTDLGKKLSNTTINNYIRNIKVFFNFLTEQRYIKTNPMRNIN